MSYSLTHGLSRASLSHTPSAKLALHKCEGMSEVLPTVYLARHGETAWSLSGQHTGLTDLPLTERGERNARALGERLRGLTFAKVFTSPLQRAPPDLRAGRLRRRRRESIAIWSNGTTASTRAGAAPRSTRSAPTGNCSATAAREENRRTQVGARADRVVEPAAGGARRRAAVFQRALSARAGRPLAGARRRGRQILPAEYGEPERAGL